MGRIKLTSIAILVVAVAALPAVAQWGGSSLFTQDGVEITVDKRVFAVFALLNAQGYDVDTDRGPPPLERPKFSEARTKVRERFRRPGPAVRSFGNAVDKNPAAAEEYLRAALTLGPAPKFAASKGTSKIGKALRSSLKSWFNQEGGGSSFRVATDASKATQKKVQKAVDKACLSATKAARFGNEEDQVIDESGAKGRVVVVVNELDAHDKITRIDLDDTIYIVTGPPSDDKHIARVARAAGVAYARTLVAREVDKVAKKNTFSDLFKKLPDGPKGFLKNDGKSFTTELVACAFFQSVSPGPCQSSPVSMGQLDKELSQLSARFKASDTAKELLKDAMPKVIAPLGAPVPPPAPPAPGPKAAPAPKPAG